MNDATKRKPKRRKPTRLRRIDPGSPAYQRWVTRLALMLCPPTEPCRRCGRPTAEGYRCEFCEPRDGRKVIVVR